ncbi:MAG: hypothetical protein AB1427_19745 [Thermodesulfobacteriota bacterium]
MNIPLAAKFEGKKYMWDGTLYETEEQAQKIADSYQKAGFEVNVSPRTDKYLVYSRRVAVAQTAA